jgi:hypothetical protein
VQSSYFIDCDCDSCLALVARISINLASHRACARLFYSLERKVLWIAPEQIADRDEPDVAELVSGYKRLFLETQFNGGDGATARSSSL